MAERDDCPSWCSFEHLEPLESSSHMHLFDLTPERWVAAALAPDSWDYPPQVLLNGVGYRSVSISPEQAQNLAGILSDVKSAPEVRALVEALRAAAALLLAPDESGGDRTAPDKTG